MKDLTTSRKIRTVSDLMGDLEGEIADIKSGKLAEGKARIVGTYRRMQLRTVEIYLQAARLEVRLRGGIAKRIGEISEAVPAPSAKSIRTKNRTEAAA
jgi:thymidine kinase